MLRDVIAKGRWCRELNLVITKVRSSALTSAVQRPLVGNRLINLRLLKFFLILLSYAGISHSAIKGDAALIGCDGSISFG